MAIPALVVGIVLGAISGIFAVFGICLFAPFVIIGSIVAFILSIFFPPLRAFGIAFLLFSVGLVLGIIINGLVVEVLL